MGDMADAHFDEWDMEYEAQCAADFASYYRPRKRTRYVDRTELALKEAAVRLIVSAGRQPPAAPAEDDDIPW